MRIVFLNTSILTCHGVFEYKPATAVEVRNLLSEAIATDAEVISAVGHEATAKIITALVNYHVPVNRIQYRQEVGDIAIVFKLRGRAPEGKILEMDEIEKIGYDFGFLKIWCESR